MASAWMSDVSEGATPGLAVLAEPEARDNARLARALLVSLLAHGVLLSLTFGDAELGLPGLALPWAVRRMEAPDLRVRLVPAQAAPQEAEQRASTEPTVPSEPAPAHGVAGTHAPRTGAVAKGLTAAPALPSEGPRVAATGAPGAREHEAPASRDAAAQLDVSAERGMRAGTEVIEEQSATPQAPLRATGIVRDAPLQVPKPAADDAPLPGEATAVVRALTPSPGFVVAPPPSASAPQPVASPSGDGDDSARVLRRAEAAREEAAREEAALVEAARIEAARQEAARVEAARLEAAHLEAERRATALLVAQQLDAQRQEVARQEVARVEAARVEAERQDNERRAAAQQLEAQREVAARQEAARLEAVRLETERREAARVEAARQETARVEAARLEAERQDNERRAAAQQLEAQREAAARQEAARLEAERREAARLEAARLEASRQEAGRREAEARATETPREDVSRVALARPEVRLPDAAPQVPASQAAPRAEPDSEEARREARLRAIGRQLDEEAAQRDAAQRVARTPSTLPLSLSTARRVRVWGRTDPNVELIRYVEAWTRKIEFDKVSEKVREATRRPHTPPMVTVAVRSDGSVESVTFVISSGVAEVDEGIRRIVDGLRPYLPFPPALARDVDVIEIRRTWYFDSAVRLY